jgi:hypothetical protein
MYNKIVLGLTWYCRKCFESYYNKLWGEESHAQFWGNIELGNVDAEVDRQVV